MNRLFCLLVTMLAPLIYTNAWAGHTKVCKWNEGKIVIDGDNTDWELPYTYDNKDNKIQYDVAMDRQMLYITLKTSNDVSEYKIKKLGLFIYIDTNGGHAEDMSIVGYPAAGKVNGAGGQDELQNSMMGVPVDTAAATPRKPFETNAGPLPLQQIMVSGFKQCNGTYAKTVACEGGPQVASGLNDFGEMVWEIAVPFAMIGMDTQNKANAQRTISIGIGMNALMDGDRPNTAMTTGASRIKRPPMGKGGGHGMDKAPDGDGSGADMPADAGREDPTVATGDFDSQARIDDLQRLTMVVNIWQRVKLVSK